MTELHLLKHDEVDHLPAGFSHALFVMGIRGHLNTKQAKLAAKGLRKLWRKSPAVELMPSISGYDDDPRELWEIEECQSYVTKFCRQAELGGFPPATWNIDNLHRHFIGTCLWPDRAIGRYLSRFDAEQGAYLGINVGAVH
jgi:hypothetical protein